MTLKGLLDCSLTHLKVSICVRKRLAFLLMGLPKWIMAAAALFAILAKGSAQVFEAEPNNAIAQASPMASGVKLTAQLGVSSDVDFFYINVPRPGSLTIDFVQSNGQGSLVTGTYNITVFNSAGTSLSTYPKVTPYTFSPFSAVLGVQDAGNYYIKIEPSSGIYDWKSTNYELTVVVSSLIPIVTSQPKSQTVLAGSNATISVSVDGVAPISYQWFKNGSAIAGATLASLQFVSVKPTDDASYYVKASNASGFVSSENAKLTVTLLPPVITTQPVNQVETVGSTSNLFTIASGLPSLSYQWYKNGIIITGATDFILSFPSVALTDAGSYSVLVSNASGSVATNPATLSVTQIPSRFINLSILTAITSGTPITAGFVISGTVNKRVLVRAVGPTLSSFGVPSAASNPAVALFNQQGAIIGANDDWLITDATTMAAVGAFALPFSSRDAALVANLAPGNYTVQVIGTGNSAGVVLVEVYEVP